MGRVSAPYGVRGMVHVQTWSEDPLALARHAVWWLRPRASEQWQPRRVSGVRPHGGALIAHLDGVATREDAAALRGADVGVARADLPALADDELYWADLEGLAVVDASGMTVGHVAGVIDNGAHPILRVRDALGTERLIPWVPAYVVGVDVEAGRIDVEWGADY